MDCRRSTAQSHGTLIVIAVLLMTMCVSITPRLHGAETVKLKFATLYPKQDSNCLGVQYMFSELEKRTNGKVKITPFYSQALGKAQEMLDMLDKGVTDIALFPPAVFPRVLVMTDVLSLPGLINKRAIATEVMYELGYRGLLDKDLAGYKVLLWAGTEPFGFGFVDKKVTTLEELRKMKVRGPGGVTSGVIEALGPSVVTIPTSDIYMALDRGVTDGLVTGPGWYFTSKINEVTKYWLWKPVGIGANLTIMKEEKWDKLPSDVKAVWTELMTETKYRFLEDVEKQIPDTRAHFSKLGIEVYSLAPAEEARWDAIFKQYIEEWIADREAKGYPARETVEAVKQIVNRFAE